MANCPTIYVNDPSLYPQVLEFASGFKFCEWKDFVRENVFGNYHLIGLAYLFTIFGIQKWMETRKALDLRIPLFTWNLLMATFSALVGYLAVLEFAFVVKREGLYGTICNHETRDGALGKCHFWILS